MYRESIPGREGIYKGYEAGLRLECLQNIEEASAAFHHIVNESQRNRKDRIRVLLVKKSENLWQDLLILFYTWYKAIGGF